MTNSESSFNSSSITSSSNSSSSSSSGEHSNNLKYLPSPRLLKRYRYSVLPSNEELNNKIDLEIRILDGILKLLNAISTAPLNNNNNDLNNGIIENSSSPTISTPINQFDSHVIQILTACKCLFVSHRKIAIYLKNSDKRDSSTSSDQIGKLYLSNIRIPLSWKWSDYIKASKNSENINTKYAVFALIWVGNMIYDTHLATNIDATCTDISFDENFIFEDVNIKDFELKIEVYSYEIFNTTTNNLISQSARKLAKHLSDFVKKSSLPSQQNLSTISGSSASSSNSGICSNNFNQHQDPYSYSSHRFKLCAQTKLNPNDISENIETRNLKLVTDSTNPLDVSTLSTNQQNNKLPLFDQFSLQLRSSPLPNAATKTIKLSKSENLDEIF